MIKIKNLTKVYKMSRKASCTALNDVSIDFPDKGMVFVLGKSGSGKSTLLNMIGTLDDATSGEIWVDGNDVVSLNKRGQQKYRSSYLGFVFQNFVLLEEFTVYENVKLALDVSGVDGDVLEVLESVELLEYKDKYPNELSGGQRQRVAIARALVKKPKVLLCDEPTGNLDYRTSGQILSKLKELSKDLLVIVVSHNLVDAEEYADRIIELFDGKILSDKSRDYEYDNSLVVDEENVILPHHKDLNDEEIEKLNKSVKDGKKVKQGPGAYYDKDVVVEGERKAVFTSSNLKIRDYFNLSRMFSRKNKIGSIYTILITALFISLLYLIQSFIVYDKVYSVYNKEKEEEFISTINLQDRTSKGSMNSVAFEWIEEEDLEKFYENGYSGESYKLYNFGLNFTGSQVDNGFYSPLGKIFDYNMVYETFGVLCTTEEFLIKLYGVNGELKLAAGSLDEASSKLVITDYVADCYIQKKSYKSYDEIVNHKRMCAIIDTGYKDRYSELYEIEKQVKQDGGEDNDYYFRVRELPLYKQFIEEIYNKLGITYLFNDEFILGDLSSTSYSFSSHSYNIIKDDKIVSGLSGLNLSYDTKNELEDNQIIFSTGTYNNLFGTFYNTITAKDFVPHKIKFVTYKDRAKSEINNVIELEVVKLSTSSIVSKNITELLHYEAYKPYKIYFEDTSQVDVILKTIEELDMYYDTPSTPTLPPIMTILNVFEGFFYIILGLLIVFSMSHILVYGIGGMKKNSYEIGVLKSQGTKEFDIGMIFILKTIFVGLCVTIVTVITTLIFINIGNKILVRSMQSLLGVAIYDVNLIRFDRSIIFVNLLMVWSISIVSALIPLLYLRKIKPLSIIRDTKNKK